MIFGRKKGKKNTFKSRTRKSLSKRRVLRRKLSKRNPLIYERTIPQRKIENSPRFLKSFYFVIIILIFLASAYILFFSDFFKIKKIVVLDNQSVTQQRIEEIANSFMNRKYLFAISGNNIFFLNSDKIADLILKEILAIKSLEISKKYPNILKIKITEKQPVAIWVTRDDKYYLDMEGVIAYSAQGLIETNLPIIQDITESLVESKEKVVTDKLLNFIYQLSSQFKSRTGDEITLFKVPSRMSQEVHVITDKGYEVYFNIEKELKPQLDDLVLVLQQQIKNRKEQIKYIDLRVDNWVYYK